MPELPEVQTTVNGLQLIIKYHITGIKINTTKLRYLIPKNITKIAKNRKIFKIYRIAKYIVFELGGNISLIFHLGMSGQMKLMMLNEYKSVKHDHILIILNNKNILIFNDPRKFGFMDFAITSRLKSKKYFFKLGLDPFVNELNKNYLLKRFKNSKSSIKQLLLNQKIINGIGNIYACEILYDAKISPFIPGNRLNGKLIDRLIKSMRKILKKAIFYGGTTLRDYIATDGKLGNFQSEFKVYNQDGKILKYKIKRVKQCGRSTYFCPGLQRSKYNPIIK